MNVRVISFEIRPRGYLNADRIIIYLRPNINPVEEGF